MIIAGFPSVGDLRGTGCIPNKETLGDVRQYTKALLVSGIQPSHFAIKHIGKMSYMLRVSQGS